MALFPSVIIQNWNYQNEKPTTEIAPFPATSYIKVQDDDVDIIFRIIQQNKKLAREKVEQQKKKEKLSKQEKAPSAPIPIHQMGLKELREHLKALGLNTDGQKIDLINRYEQFAKRKK